MTGCRVLALPGGNPAPLVTLAWALHGAGVRVAEVHAVLYASAQKWLHSELLGGVRPLDQLRDALGDPALATLIEHPATRDDGSLVEEDAAAADGEVYRETAWRVARMLQEDPTPLVFALVSGRRRTLVADLVVAFQLLARPQDRLVELRLSPREAIDPATGFYFPTQTSLARVQRYDMAAPIGAAEVRVEAIDVRVPRLRRLLPAAELATYAGALAAGEAAIAAGGNPIPRVDLRARTVAVGDTVATLSHDQMVWYATLAVARRTRPDGLVAPDDDALIARVFAACLGAWFREPQEMSDGWTFGELAHPERLRLRGPIRSRLRRDVARAFDGHPWRRMVVPQVRRAGTGADVRTMERLETPEIALCPRLQALCGEDA